MNVKSNHQNRRCLHVLTLVALALPTPFLYAASGDLDTTFGNGGKVVTDFGGADDEAHVIAIQPDGKIILAGFTETIPDQSFTSIALARYMPDGNLDSSFGNSGKVTTDLGEQSSVTDIVLQHDGKILIPGNTARLTTFEPLQNFIMRYNPNGSVDGGFGNSGKLIVNELGRLAALVLHPDNKMIVAGSSTSGDFALVRYNSDGSLDTSFGSNGLTTTDLGASDAITDIILQPNGKIIAVGSSGIPPLALSAGTSFLALARYNSNGSLDTDFGTAGKIVANELGTPTAALAVTLQGDGKIVVAGAPNLVRYNNNGAVDTSFGSGGKVIIPGVGTSAAGVGASAVVLQSDGKIITGGGATIGGTSDFFVFRYQSDGSLDNSFGSGGKSLTDFSGRPDHAWGLALQPDGRILAAGVTYFPTLTVPRSGNSDFALARYQGDSPAPISGSSGGGGGCTLNPRSKPDATLPLLLVMAMLYLLRRRLSE